MRRNWSAAAFDLSPTAISHCRSRFPGSAVDYRVADLFELPDQWSNGFELVVEVRTLQSLPPTRLPEAITALAGLARPGGTVFVHCLARSDHEHWTSRPWPLSRNDLATFTAVGLRETQVLDQPEESGPDQSFTIVYTRDQPPETV